MTDLTAMEKDAERQHLVPTEWRPTLKAIADAFVERDFKLGRDIPGVLALTEADAKYIADNIAAYGASLVVLPEATWCSSVCQWMGDYWAVLVDLYTQEEGVSDLALSVRVFEKDTGYVFDVQSVHVP